MDMGRDPISLSKFAVGSTTIDYLPCVVEGDEIDSIGTQSPRGSDLSLGGLEADIDAGCVVAEEAPSFQILNSHPSHTHR